MLTLIALGILVSADLVAWALFRVDKARARRGRWRIAEATLLTWAAIGGLGALVAMFGHRQRHKVSKRRFVRVATLGAIAHGAAIAWLTYRAR